MMGKEKVKILEKCLGAAILTAAFVLLFPIDVSAASYFSDEMISFGRDAAQESVQAEDGFVLVPGGTFQMGSPAGEPERGLDEIQHSVTVRNFYMAKSELSQEDYEAVMGMNPSVTKGSNLPVTNITWYDAVQYCNKRSTAEGLIPCYRVQYDTILLGYCNWWSSIPASVRSFLLHDDFGGKTIVPFCSMGGGHFGQTISAIAKLAPESVIREGLEVTYSSYDRNEISAWLEKSLPVQGEDEGSPLPGDKICEHSYRTDIVPATARQDGSITRICVFCGTVESRSVIPKAESLKLSKTSYTYNGKLKKPGITIEDSQGGMLEEGKDYTLSYPDNAKNPGIYKVTVRFKDNYSGTMEESFSIKPKGINISKLLPKKGGVLVKWKKQKQVLSGYEISYSTSRKFTKNTTRSVISGKGRATSKSVSKLKTGQRYYVRIRAFRTLNVDGKQKRLYSAWSKTETVKTEK